SKEHRKYYTLVLKGHLGLCRAVFPKGTTGSKLDVLAREHLWHFCADYAHGTGHGVGSFLGVHEGPQRINSVSKVEL
ncbi:M24 family metallopeptidase, partial [Francisella tularensis]|uniref:M24 family metallopeptidase n=1 Tax=Francisella tularensis TaxID=263 RepID=UPI002381C867